MKVPAARGPFSAAVRDHLTGDDQRARPQLGPASGSTDDAHDRSLALWMLFELFYRGFDGVDPDLEWDPTLLGLRTGLEQELEAGLRRDFAAWEGKPTLAGVLEGFADHPGTASYVRSTATSEEVLSLLRLKSVYHLKESDPHCFVLPRLENAPKAALAELQYDELGDGQPERVHSQLFADALAGAGLDPTYGAYVGEADVETLTSSNALSMLCLRRRLRHAAMGHLAAFEATSSLPCTDMVRGLRRLGFDESVVRYYDEHVEADAVHELLARDGICARLTEGDPRLEHEVAFGAFVCLELEARAGDRFLAAVS